MSGIYIPGMEMPTTCAECRLSTAINFKEKPLCDVLVEYMRYGEWLSKRLDNCPLIPVPPHGDLIDRDKVNLTDFEIVMCNGDYKEGMKMLLEKIESAPTIIPEEGQK